MDTRKLVLVNHLVYCFALLRYVDLVLVGVICHLFKEVVDIFEAAGTRFYVGHGLTRIDPVSKYLLLVHLPLVLRCAKVALVSNNYYGDVRLLLIALALVIVLRRYTVQEVIAPLVDALVAVNACKVEYDNATVSAAVEAVAQALEALLARRIPDLERNNISVPYLNLFFNKICAYGSLLREAGLFILEALNYACFSYARVANDNDF